MQYQTRTQEFTKDGHVHGLLTDIVDTLAAAEDGKPANLDFLTREQIASFCAALGIRRNWSELKLDEIAPMQPEGVQVVPEDETIAILSALQILVDEKKIDPSADGKKAPHLINDFLPEQEKFQGEDCLGHLWEFRYALAVELEHGTTRGTNVTNNHPLLTGMVVLAHLSEDTLYYARLWVLESEGALFNAQLEGQHGDKLLEIMRHHALATKHLQARLSEKIDKA